MARPTIPSSLGGIEFDCIIDRTTTYEAEAPEYPIESGFYVGDSILRKPIQLSVNAFITNTPVTWKGRHAGQGRVQEVCDKLKKMFFSGELQTFITPSKVYKNMAILSLNIPEGEYENAVEISFTLKEVTVTSAKTIKISSDYEQSGDSGSDAGTTGTTDETSGTKKKSLLKRIWGWISGKN